MKNKGKITPWCAMLMMATCKLKQFTTYKSKTNGRLQTEI